MHLKLVMFPTDLPAGFFSCLLTAVVGFDKHSSLVGIRATLTSETKVPNVVINGAITCAGTPMGAYFIMALMDSGVKTFKDAPVPRTVFCCFSDQESVGIITGH